MHKERGQTLVIIVLVMVLALSIGITTSSRFIRSLRSVTRTQTGYRSSAVADALLERMLLKTPQELDAYITNNNCGSECTLQVTNSDGVVESATVTFTRLGNSSQAFSIPLSINGSSEVNLAGYPNNTNLTVCWNEAGLDPVPSVVGMLVYGTLGNYDATSAAYNSASSIVNNNFSQASPANGYSSCFVVSSQTSPQLLRLRALYQNVDVMVFPHSSAVIPSQGILIESVGTSLDTSTKIGAIRGSNKTPYLFDYVIYSKSDTNPLAN